MAAVVWRAHLAIAALQLIFAGYDIISKVALNDGVNQIVFAVYRDLIALSILAPLAFFREKSQRPPMDRHIFLTLCFLGLTGTFGNQVLFLVGLRFTNPSYAAAFMPSVPVFTFLLAVIMRVETLNLRKFEGQTKLTGAIICVSGAVVLVLFRGPPLLKHIGSLTSNLLEFGIDNWQLGTLCLTGNCLCIALYLVFQAPLLSKYPASISVTAYSIFFGTLFMVATSLLLSLELSDWILTRSEILAVCYAGFVSSALSYSIMSWSNTIIGPSLIGFYSPLETVASNILSRILLGSQIFLGSIVGGLLIIAGLYLVTWASYSEKRTRNIAEPLLDRGLSTSESPFELPNPSNSTTNT